MSIFLLFFAAGASHIELYDLSALPYSYVKKPGNRGHKGQAIIQGTEHYGAHYS